MYFLSNPFNDPSDPWYYVIGTLFLILIFAALAAYVLLQKKFGKKNSETDEKPIADEQSDKADNKSDHGSVEYDEKSDNSDLKK